MNDENFDEKDDDDENLDEKDLDEDLEEPEEEKPKPAQKKPTPPPAPVKSKTPATTKGKKISLFFVSTIGPGEKKQKLLVDDNNSVGAVKKTVGNIFGLDPEDFHLSTGGVTMDENSPLKEFGVSDGDEVLLIPASTAGL